MANVAQLVEPRFVVPVVVGSSPIDRPIYKLRFGGVFLYIDRALRFEPVLFRKVRFLAHLLHFGQVIVTFVIYAVAGYYKLTKSESLRQK